MKNICKVKKAILGCLFVIPATIATIYISYSSVVTIVAWWPLYNNAPIILHVFFLTILAFLSVVAIVVILSIIKWWTSLIMEIGGWVKSKLEK